MIAGGFGIGTSATLAPTDLAPVVPYRDGRSVGDLDTSTPTADVEGGGNFLKKSSSNHIGYVEYSQAVDVETPFFHLDLQAAVKAAEGGLHRVVNL